jgi:hypothetical protein
MVKKAQFVTALLVFGVAFMIIQQSYPYLVNAITDLVTNNAVYPLSERIMGWSFVGVCLVPTGSVNFMGDISSC